MRRRLPLFFLLTPLAPLGCLPSPNDATPRTTAVTSPAPASTPTGRPAADAVTLDEVTVAQFDAALAKLKGKVVMVDVWFLGCDPCKKKFPDMVRLHHKYAEDGLTMVSLDMMPSEVPVKPRVLAFLTKQQAAFPNYLFNDTDEALDAWRAKAGFSVTPAVLLYDRAGVKAATLEEPTMEAVELRVRALLAKK